MKVRKKFEVNNVAIRSRQSKNRQYNRQKDRANNDLQNTTQKTKD